MHANPIFTRANLPFAPETANKRTRAINSSVREGNSRLGPAQNTHRVLERVSMDRVMRDFEFFQPAPLNDAKVQMFERKI